MAERKYELIEELERLVQAQEAIDTTGQDLTIRFDTSFLREVLDELRDKIDIYGPSGDLVCTISGPEASTIIDMAVQAFVQSALIRFTEEG